MKTKITVEIVCEGCENPQGRGDLFHLLNRIVAKRVSGSIKIIDREEIADENESNG